MFSNVEVLGYLASTLQDVLVYLECVLFSIFTKSSDKVTSQYQ